MIIYLRGSRYKVLVDGKANRTEPPILHKPLCSSGGGGDLKTFNIFFTKYFSNIYRTAMNNEQNLLQRRRPAYHCKNVTGIPTQKKRLNDDRYYLAPK